LEGFGELNLLDYDAIIFDLDGTILDSSDDVMLCLEEAFDKEKLQINKSKLTHNIIGPPLDKIAKSVLSTLTDEQANKIVDNYNEIYDSEKYDSSRMYSGMFQLLVELKEAGKKLFIATYKPDFSTHRLIKKFNLTMFDDIYTIDKYQDKTLTKKEMLLEIIEKYNLNKTKTIMIGDALGDILAAKANEITAVGALWGYGDYKQPLIDNADYSIDSVENLKNDFLKELI